MFENLEEKLKTLASIILILGIIGSVVGGCFLWIKRFGFWPGFICCIGGCLSSIITSWFTYAIGEILDKTLRIHYSTIKKSTNTSYNLDNVTLSPQAKPSLICPDCKSTISKFDKTCPHCGTKIPF